MRPHPAPQDAAIPNDSVSLTFERNTGFNLHHAMANKRFTAKKLARIEATTRFIQWVNKVLCLCLAVAFGLLIAATAAPQKKEYEKLKAKLRNVQNREEETLAHKEYNYIQLQALREDPSYLEVQARDRLNYYRAGERVLRFDGGR
jgi:hypothetical protein